MRRRAPFLLLALLLALLVALPLRAQAAEPPSVRLRRTLRALERVEIGIATSSDSSSTGPRAEQQRLIVAARALLDTVVLRAPDGRAALAGLEREFPGGALLREYAAWRLLADGQPADALARFDALLRASRRNLGLLRGRARALDALHQDAEAGLAWARVFTENPHDDEAFEELWRRHEAARSLAQLARDVARMRVLYPADTVLLGREVRLLQALGLPDSAAAVARRFHGGPS